MSRIKTVLLTVVVTLLVGCGPPEKPVENDIRNPDVYAGRIKSEVVSYLQWVEKDPGRGEKQTHNLIQVLETYPSAPVGEHGETYRKLLENCQKLNQIYSQSDSSGKATKFLKDTITLAKELPGELVILTED